MPRQPDNERIADAIREQIRTGQLRPGDRLPSQAQLAEQYGVSQQPVKTALRDLQREGLLVGQQGKGVFVAER